MPNPNARVRDDAMRLLTLLREVRAAKPEARDFALFDRRDAIARLGVPHDEIDAFDATDDDALDRHIADARAVATAYGAPEDEAAILYGGGQDVMIGSDADDLIRVTAAKPRASSPPPEMLWPQNEPSWTPYRPVKPLANPLLPEIPWSKNGPTWTPYAPAKGILPEPAKTVAPPKPVLPGTSQERALLDIIGGGEIDEARAKAAGFASTYDTPYNYGRFARPPKPLTQMTLGQLRDFQRQTREAQTGVSGIRSSAMGRYQVMPNTLADMQRALKLSDDDLFSPEMQDRMALELLRRPMEDYLAGKIDAAGLQNRIAGRWASVPTASGSSYHKNQSARVEQDKLTAAILNLRR